GQWHHLIGTWNGSLARVYVDGTIDAELAVTGTLVANTTGVTIGRDLSVAGYLHGTLDEPAVFGPGLSASQVAQHYALAAAAQIATLSSVIASAAGSVHSLALKNDGTVWSWGGNTNGQVGDGTTNQRTSPVQVTTLSSVIAIAAGADHSLALKSDGTIWTWGKNSSGQIGDGTTTNRPSPTQVTSVSTLVTAIGAEGDCR